MSKKKPTPDDRWNDNEVQFARLLCELVANWGGPEVTRTLNAMADSMDLTVGEINKLFDRAHDVWEAYGR
jgi:hypothetical protein